MNDLPRDSFCHPERGVNYAEETMQTQQQERTFLNILTEFKILKSCNRSEEEKEMTGWGKLSFPFPQSFGTIIDEFPEASHKARTGVQHGIHIPDYKQVQIPHTIITLDVIMS